MQWQEVLQSLADKVTGWAQEVGWTTRVTEAQVLEGYPYPPTLDIEAPEGHLKLELPPHRLRHPHPRRVECKDLYHSRA